MGQRTMDNATLDTLRVELALDESTRRDLYDDATGAPIVTGTKVRGNPSIGIGRNLLANPLSNDEVQLLLNNDIARAIAALDSRLPWWKTLPPGMQRAMANLTFNMGINGLMTFHRFLAAMEAQDRPAAAQELRDSLWFGEVGERGPRVVALILEVSV